MKTNLLSSTLLTIFLMWIATGCSQNTKQSGKDRNETPASSSEAKA